MPPAIGPVDVRLLDLPLFEREEPAVLTRAAIFADPWPGPVAIGGAGFLCFTGGAVLLLTLPSDSTGAAKASGRQAFVIGWQSRF